MPEQNPECREPSADDYDVTELLVCAQLLAENLGLEIRDPEPAEWDSLTVAQRAAAREPPTRELVDWAFEVAPEVMALLERQEGESNVASGLDRQKFLSDQFEKFCASITFEERFHVVRLPTAGARVAAVLEVVERIGAEGFRQPRAPAAAPGGSVSGSHTEVRREADLRISRGQVGESRRGAVPAGAEERRALKGAAGKLPACFVQPSAPPEWEALGRCARCLLEVIVARSRVAPKSSLRYFDKGVGWLCVVCGYARAQVRRGLKELREAGFIVSVAPAKQGERCEKYRVMRSLDEVRKV